MPTLRERVSGQENIWIVAAVGAGVIIIPFAIYSKIQKSKRTANTGFPPLPPPIGPSLSELFPSLNADRQIQTIQHYGNYFTSLSPMPFLIPNQVVINDPAVVQELTIKQANMYRTPSRFTTRSNAFAAATRSVVGTGVTGLKEEAWRWRKTAILKEFHKSRMMEQNRGLIECMVQVGKQLCNQLESAATKPDEPVMVDVLTTGAAVSVILYFLFGRTFEFDADEMRQSAKDLMECLGFLITHPFHGISKYFPGTDSYKMEVKKKHAWQVIDSIVATEIKFLLEEQAGTRPIHPERKPGSVMASLIAKEPRFREGGVDSMIAEARVFVQAGFETTAHSLSFSLAMIAERPDLAERMAQAGVQALGGAEDWNTNLMLQALDGNKTNIVKNFFMEAVRLYPLAPVLGGECTADIVIETKSGDKFGLPKGTACLFPNLTNQRHVKDPDTIIPERWDVDLKSQPFLHTFQNGAHSCPGKPLSQLEGHIFLLMIATKFEFQFPPGILKVEFEDNLLLRPKDGMPLLVKRRNY